MSSVNPDTLELKQKHLISPIKDDVLLPNGDPVGYDLRQTIREVKPRGQDLACPFASHSRMPRVLWLRSRPKNFRDHFSQATLKWESMSDEQQDHTVKAF